MLIIRRFAAFTVESRSATCCLPCNTSSPPVNAGDAAANTADSSAARTSTNLCDPTLRAFNARVPQIWQWDDHETCNNWSPTKDLSADARFTEKRIATLVSRSTRAFLEHAPLRWHTPDESERVYRRISYGPDLDLFVLDMRS